MSADVGHLYGGFFQLGYVTRDLDRAIPAYNARFGKTEFLVFPTPSPADGTVIGMTRIALAYIGSVMIELIEVMPDAPSIYLDALPVIPGAIALHHLGFLIDDYEAMLAHLQANAFIVKPFGTSPNLMDYAYADTRRETGTYSEFIHLHPAGAAFFANVPRNEKR